MRTRVRRAFVLWDVMSCPLPTEEEQCPAILANIRTAVFTHSLCTGIGCIMAIGANYTPRPIPHILHIGTSLVVCLPEFQVGKMIHEMRYWAKGNPAPATYLVISGNKALSSTLEKLHNRNYNILVAHPDGDSTDVAATASCVWNFTSLLHGGSPYLVRKNMVPPIFAFPELDVRTFVLWDVRSCPLPTDESECHDIVDGIYFAVFANCSCTDISMTAVGTNGTPCPILNLLNSHMWFVDTCPESENHVTNMIDEMNRWAMSNPVPANILVISGDAALSSALEKLQSRNYNILVAHPGVHSADLVATASRAWHFKSLLSGESPYFVRTEMVLRRAEEPSKQTPAAIVRPKKKTKYQRPKRVPKTARGLLELEMNQELRQREIH